MVVSGLVSAIATYFLGFRGLEFGLLSIAGFLFLYLIVCPFVAALAEPAGRVRLRQPTDFPVRFPNGPSDK